MTKELTQSPVSPELTTISEMTQLAKAVATSKLFGMQTPEQALVLMALCRSEGKDPIQAVRQYHIINGKPSMRADAMLGEFQARGGKVQWGERTNTAVSGTFSHPSGGELTVTWTLKDAQEAGLTGNPTWKKFPRQMLTARVISEAIRTVLPGVVAGIYAPEEVMDFEPLPAPKVIEPPIVTDSSRRIDPSDTQDARKAFYALCDSLDIPLRADNGKPDGKKVMQVLHFLGWPQATPPATGADWSASEGFLGSLSGEDLAKLRGELVPKPIETADLTDPFAEGAQ